MRYKISVIGAFGFGREMRDGQTVKTKETYKLLTEKYGKEAIYAVDTLGWSKAPWRLFHGVVCAARNSECVIMLPARNALKVIPYLLFFTKRNNTKVFYSVIGGWLPEFLQDKPQLSKLLKRLNGIWVETNTMKRKLDADGFGNITVVPNFKELNVLKKEELVYPELSPMRLCIFSRINKMKGIEDAVRAIKEVNAESGRTVYTLDMYGLISDEFKQDFDKLCKEAPPYIQYKGCIPPEQSVGVIKNYFALLFPTLYPTEGIPGTIIDAYSAGVPVISAKWNSFVDIVDESKTGIGFTQGDFNSLKSALKEIAIAPEVLCNMKPECLKKAKVYSPEITKELILRLLTRGGKVLRLIFFARVMQEKGIEEAVEVIQRVNTSVGTTVFSLDIYGIIDASYSGRFTRLWHNAPEYIQYKGCVDASRSVEILKDYYMLLFPSFYPGEGLAGTIIDAYSAGIPVVSSDWRYNAEIVNHGETGFVFETHNIQAFYDILIYAALHKQEVFRMKGNCLKEATKYSKSKVAKKIYKELAINC